MIIIVGSLGAYGQLKCVGSLLRVYLCALCVCVCVLYAVLLYIICCVLFCFLVSWRRLTLMLDAVCGFAVFNVNEQCSNTPHNTNAHTKHKS